MGLRINVQFETPNDRTNWTYLHYGEPIIRFLLNITRNRMAGDTSPADDSGTAIHMVWPRFVQVACEVLDAKNICIWTHSAPAHKVDDALTVDISEPVWITRCWRSVPTWTVMSNLWAIVPVPHILKILASDDVWQRYYAAERILTAGDCCIRDEKSGEGAHRRTAFHQECCPPDQLKLQEITKLAFAEVDSYVRCMNSRSRGKAKITDWQAAYEWLLKGMKDVHYEHPVDELEKACKAAAIMATSHYIE